MCKACIHKSGYEVTRLITNRGLNEKFQGLICKASVYKLNKKLVE